MDRQLPTFGQLERQLSQSIQKLYREELGHLPQKITCKLYGDRLFIVIEDAFTAVEKTLVDKYNEDETINNLNLAIGNIVSSKLKTIIEAVLAVEVEDILFSSNVKTKRAGAISILSQPPQGRNPTSSPKLPKSKRKNEDDTP